MLVMLDMVTLAVAWVLVSLRVLVIMVALGVVLVNV